LIKDTFVERWYAPFLLALWVLMPEARRLVDWQIGFNSLPVINLIPVVAFQPLVAVCLGRRSALRPADFTLVMWLWIGAFVYAALVGWSAGGSLGTIYECALFAFPLLVGLWLAALNRSLARRIFERFANAALWLAVITSAYALYQFIAPPPWDVAWVLNSGLESIGKPEPFGLRIFGTMNSSGVLADFLAMAILLTLYRLRRRTIWLFFPLLVCAGALALTFARSAWLELALGLVVFVALSPRRGAALATVGAGAILTLALSMNLSLITGDPSSNTQVQSRLATLNDLQNDESANARADETSVALRQSLAEPLGQGLGAVGTATKLTAGSTTVLDNGYLTRFVEMGIFGMACYLFALVVGLVMSLVRLRACYAARDDQSASLVATAVAIQVALLGAELSGDHHYALMGIVFWLVVGFTSTIAPEATQFARSRTAGQEPNIGRPAQA